MTTYGKSFDADNLTGRNHEGESANTPVRVLTASSIIGDDVENPQGEKLGDVKDIMLNVRNGNIEYIVLQVGGFLGIGEKLFAIPFHALTLNTDNHSFVLNIPKDRLKNAPGFDKDHWPETNSRHYDDVNTYWGDFMGPNAGREF